MNVLIDTCIWSEALRKKQGNAKTIETLQNFLVAGKVEIIGPIRQELLSGISNKDHFVLLKKKLEGFIDIPLKTEHFEYAAELSNECRKKGIQGSSVDFLICAVAKKQKLIIYTNDPDFDKYSHVFGLNLFKL